MVGIIREQVIIGIINIKIKINKIINQAVVKITRIITEEKVVNKIKIGIQFQQIIKRNQYKQLKRLI